jgi:hypothetical protein
MLYTDCCGRNGLKLSGTEVSGELSMVRVGPLEPLPLLPVADEPLEQAASPAVRSPAASAATALLLESSLIVIFDFLSDVTCEKGW